MWWFPLKPWINTAQKVSPCPCQYRIYLSIQKKPAESSFLLRDLQDLDETTTGFPCNSPNFIPPSPRIFAVPFCCNSINCLTSFYFSVLLVIVNWLEFYFHFLCSLFLSVLFWFQLFMLLSCYFCYIVSRSYSFGIGMDYKYSKINGITVIGPKLFRTSSNIWITSRLIAWGRSSLI